MNLSQFNAQIVPLRNKLYRLALRITGSVHESEDVVQEVFEKIWLKKESEAWAAVQNWEAMSMTITRNLSLDKSKAKSHQVMKPWPVAFDRADTSSDAPDQLVTASETMALVAQVIAQMPEKQRTVLHLREVEDQTYEQIVETMQISIEDVKVTLHRARKTLREKLLSTHQLDTKS
jgi:RNA polymerase sigma factor (sigma-70 family)